MILQMNRKKMTDNGGTYEKIRFKVQMFGTYSIEYEGNPVSFERNTTTKTNQLMQILLQAGEKGVTEQNFCQTFLAMKNVESGKQPPGNCVSPAQAFSGSRTAGREYVTIRGGSYYWTSGIPYELDAHRFETLLDKAGKENDPEKKKSYIEEACELYRGEFLPQLGAEGWAVVLNVYYKNLFSNAMRTLCQI